MTDAELIAYTAPLAADDPDTVERTCDVCGHVVMVSWRHRNQPTCICSPQCHHEAKEFNRHHLDRIGTVKQCHILRPHKEEMAC